MGLFNFPCATEVFYYSTPSPDYSDRKFQLYAFLYQLFLLPYYHPITILATGVLPDFLNTFTTSAQSIAAKKSIPMTNNKQLGMTISIADRHKSTLRLIKILSYHNPSSDTSSHLKGKRKKNFLW